MSVTGRPVIASSAGVPRFGVEPRPSRPIPQRVTRSSSSSSTATVAPAIAKSPCRRANSCTEKPHRPDHTGNPTAVRISSGCNEVSHSPVKNSGGRDLPAPARGRRLDPRVERERDGGVFRGGIGVRDGTAERAAGADLEVPDVRCRQREQRNRFGHFVVHAHQRVRRGRADPHLRAVVVVTQLDVLQLVDAGDVDEVLEVRQAHRQHGHQALPAREDLRVVAVLAQQPHRVRDRVGAVVGELGRLQRGLHDSSRASAACRSSASSAAGLAARRFRRRPTQEADDARGRGRGQHRPEPLGHRQRRPP